MKLAGRILTTFILILLAIQALPCFAIEVVDTAWVRRYDGPANGEDRAVAIAIDGSGNVYVTGSSVDSLTSDDYATVKYYPNGDTAWVRRHNGTGNSTDYAHAIAVDGSGNVYVTGESKGLSATFNDYATVKYYPNGNTAWVRRYNGPGDSTDYAYAMAVDGSGNVYVTGESYGSGTYADYATIKYYPNGDTAWVRRYNGPGDSTDYAYAIAVDGSGNVYVTGESRGLSVTFNDYATIKYYSNGDTAWVRRYNGPVNGRDRAAAIAVDGSDNVYVTGLSFGSGGSYDYATIKYYSNGDTAWVRRYNAPGNSEDRANAVAIDGSGNVYVTGESYGGTNFDYATIKYYPNGDTAWVGRYDGPGNDIDDAFAIIVDGSGNVYVTGTSYGDGTDVDYATIKYYSSGDIAWVTRYNGSENLSDNAQAIALDSSNNVYVTGYSYGSGTNYDYATIKYIQFATRPDTLWIVAYSPVDLIVTDPAGDSIGLEFNTIQDATYDDNVDWNEDEDLDDVVTIPHPYVGEYQIRVIREDGVPDTATYDLGIRIDGSDMDLLADGDTVPPADGSSNYSYDCLPHLKGDVNCDDVTNSADIVFLINYLFKSGPAPDPLELGDVNCDEVVNSADVVYMINYLFKGGPAPCS
jgi:hypothetical protein